MIVNRIRLLVVVDCSIGCKQLREDQFMALLDRVKAGATQAVQMAQEAGKAGQAKLDEIQAKRQLDGLFRDLGAVMYAQHAGRSTPETTATIERLFSEIEAHEAEHGESPDDPESDAKTSDGDNEGGYTLE
jgi:2-keto-3-deoxy-L-rhamnonate aldolase RhmA